MTVRLPAFCCQTPVYLSAPLPPQSSFLRVTWDAGSQAWSPKCVPRIKPISQLLGCLYFLSRHQQVSMNSFLVILIYKAVKGGKSRTKHFWFTPLHSLVLWASLVAQTVKNLPAMQESWVWSLGQEDPLEKRMATHSSTLVWRIPWTEEPGRIQSMGSQRVGHNWVTNTYFQSLYHFFLAQLTWIELSIYYWIKG